MRLEMKSQKSARNIHYMNKFNVSIKNKKEDMTWNLLYHDGNTYDTDISEEEKLYKRLCAPQNKDRPYEQRDLGENMTLVNQVIGQYWKPRYLLDNEAKCAYEFMSIDEVLQICQFLGSGNGSGICDAICAIGDCAAILRPIDLDSKLVQSS